MHHFKARNLNQCYHEILEVIIASGKCVSPRELKTYEIHPCLIELTHPKERTLQVLGRWENLGFSLMEALWILNGQEDVATMEYWVPHIKTFSDDGVIFNAPYGERLRHYGPVADRGDIKMKYIDQFEAVYRKLKDDPDTRQAVMMIWNPAMDNMYSRDIPCTNWLHFLIRDGKLDLTVVMRGNDILWGTPYNIFNFTLIQEIVAGWLGIDPGTYYHFTDSMHVYEDKLDMVARILGNRNYVDVYEYADPLDAQMPKKQFDTMLPKLYRSIFNMLHVEEDADFPSYIMNEYWDMYLLGILARNDIRNNNLERASKTVDIMLPCDFKYSLVRSLSRKGVPIDNYLTEHERFNEFLKENPSQIRERAKSWQKNNL